MLGRGYFPGFKRKQSIELVNSTPSDAVFSHPQDSLKAVSSKQEEVEAGAVT